MNVIPPLAITDARLTSSTAVEIAPAAYAADTTYGKDGTVSVAGSAGLVDVYKSLQADNTGHAPASSPMWWKYIGSTYQLYSATAAYALGDLVLDAVNHLVYESLIANTGAALTDKTKWRKKGPSNRLAMFDLKRNTATVQPGEITVVLTPGVRVDSIALFGLVANAVNISVTANGATVFSAVEDLNAREVLNWRDFYFRPFYTKPSIVRFDLPPYTNAVITITITATSGDAKCGACVIGSYEYIGDVQYDADDDVLNFSSVTRDFEGGINEMIQRRNVPKLIGNIVIKKSQVNRMRALRDLLNASPAVWAGIVNSNDGYFEALLKLGFYRKWKINMKYPIDAVMSLEIEEN